MLNSKQQGCKSTVDAFTAKNTLTYKWGISTKTFDMFSFTITAHIPENMHGFHWKVHIEDDSYFFSYIT